MVPICIVDFSQVTSGIEICHTLCFYTDGHMAELLLRDTLV